MAVVADLSNDGVIYFYVAFQDGVIIKTEGEKYQTFFIFERILTKFSSKYRRRLLNILNFK